MSNLENKEIEYFYSICEESFFPPIDLTKYDIPENILQYIPERTALAYQVIPIALLGDVLTVATKDPLNISAIDSLRFLTQMEISPVIALSKQIIQAINKNYSLVRDKEEREAEKDVQEEKVSEIDSFKAKKFNLKEIAKLSKDAKVIEIVNKILSEAVMLRTSDIHIEPYEKDVRIRYRVDGILYESKIIKKTLQEAIAARIKIMSRLDITQRRMPQDGRFSFSMKEKQMDVRVSILPVDFGEKIVLRLLDKDSINLTIEELGFSSYAFDAFENAISKPLGMILITGPTGSGKTTTLYTILNRLNTYDKSLVTIEDPVEYNLNGVSQIPIKHDIGLGFSHILRATLRQCPDVIMVGEIRDNETVDIAMKAALTGHVVFSTLHTNDAPSAITRLLNMGVEPFLISFSLNMIAAQRLVRKICVKCKESYDIDLTKVIEIPLRYRERNAILYRGKGCPDCRNSGYKGRIAIVEALTLDNNIRSLILKRASTGEIREYAIKHGGMKSLREDATDKCFKGETTLEELVRVTTEI